MHARLTVSVLAVALLIASSLASIASQSGHFVGVHEVPPFVCDRVELVAGLASDRSAGGVGVTTLPGAHDSICARTADG